MKRLESRQVHSMHVFHRRESYDLGYATSTRGCMFQWVCSCHCHIAMLLLLLRLPRITIIVIIDLIQLLHNLESYFCNILSLLILLLLFLSSSVACVQYMLLSDSAGSGRILESRIFSR